MAVKKVAPTKKAVKTAPAWEPRPGPTSSAKPRSPAKKKAVLEETRADVPRPGLPDKPPPGKPKPKTKKIPKGPGNGKPAPEVVLSHPKPTKRPPRVPIKPAPPPAPATPPAPPPGKEPWKPATLTDANGNPLPSFLVDPQAAMAAIMPPPKTEEGNGGYFYGTPINKGTPAKRHTKFTREVFLDICDYVAEGHTLTDICELFKDDPNYPTVAGFMYWIAEADKPENRDNPEKEGMCGLSLIYTRAIEARQDAWEARMLRAAAMPNERLKTTVTESEKDGRTTKTESYDNVERSRLFVGALQWIMSKSGKRATEAPDIRVHGGLPPEPEYEDDPDDQQDEESEEDGGDLESPDDVNAQGGIDA